MFPTLSEALTGERLTVGPPFFNKWMASIGLTAAAAGRHRSADGLAEVVAASHVAKQLVGAAGLLAVLAVGGVVVALGVRVWSSGICFALCGFSFGTIMQEFVGGAHARQTTTGTDVFTALVRPRRQEQAALRRLHRSPGRRVDLPRALPARGSAASSRSSCHPASRRHSTTTSSGMDALRVTEDEHASR